MEHRRNTRPVQPDPLATALSPAVPCSAVADHDDLSGRVLGGMVLRGRLGSGGWGDVYLADQPALGRPAVVKVLGQSLRRREAAARRFRREAQLASQLEHPNAAHIYGYGVEADGLAWIAMELVRGVTLASWIHHRGPLTLDQIDQVARGLCEVLQVAHLRGIIHRDLKPSNIMVVERAGRLEPKLLDFGVARMIDDDLSGNYGPPVGARLTATDQTVGTPAYMAPEQWQTPDQLDHRVDVYALGAVLYECATGRRPYAADTAERYAELHIAAPVPSIGDTLPVALDLAIGRALAKRREDRPGNALELSAAIRAAVEDHAATQLRQAAATWERRGRAPGLLWSGAALADAPDAVEPRELEFLAAGLRRARLLSWGARAAAFASVSLIAGVVTYRGVVRDRTARAVLIGAEVDAGRGALLHGDAAEARSRLGAAIASGDDSPATAWMLERARDPQRTQIAAIPSAGGRAWGAAWSPDGSRLVALADGGSVSWTESEATPMDGRPAYAAAWSSSGLTLAGAVVRVVGGPELAPAGTYRAIGWADGDRQIVAVEAARGAIVRWAASGARLGDVPIGRGGYYSLAVGARWATGTAGLRAAAVRLADGAVSWLPAEGVHVVAQDPRGDRVAYGTAAGDLALWEPGGSAAAPLRWSGRDVGELAWSPDGALLASSSDDEVEIWDVATRRVVSMSRADSRVTAIAWDDASAQIAVGTRSGSLTVLDARRGGPLALLDGHAGGIASLSWRSGRIASAGLDGQVRIWSSAPTYRQWSRPGAAADCGVSITAVPDGPVAIVPCIAGPTRVWDMERGELLAELPALEDPPALPVLSPDARRAAIARGDAVEIYAVPGGALERTERHAARVTALAWGPLGLAVGTEGVDALATLPDGRPLRALDDGTLEQPGVWRARIGARARALRVSPDGRRVLVLPRDSSPPALVDTATGRVLADLAHADRVHGARWTHGALLTAGSDGTVRRWTEDGSPAGVYAARGRPILDATQIGDLIIGGSDDTLLWWDAATGRRLWSLPTTGRRIRAVREDLAGGIDVRDASGSISRWRVPRSDGSASR